MRAILIAFVDTYDMVHRERVDLDMTRKRPKRKQSKKSNSSQIAAGETITRAFAPTPILPWSNSSHRFDSRFESRSLKHN